MSTAAPIGYAPLPRGYRLRRARRIVFGVGVGAVVLLGIYYWPLISRLGHEIYWERKSLRYTAPAGTIVYSNDPQDISRLSGGGYTTNWKLWPAGTFVLKPNQTFQKHASTQSGNSVQVAPAVFLHARSTPSGVQRLVAIQLDRTFNDLSNGFSLSPHVHPPLFTAGTRPANPPGGLRICLKPTDVVRLYDGQPDPADASHFTIDCDLNGMRGTIDGKLNTTGTVTLTPRGGRVVVSGGTGCWSPTGAPMPVWANEISNASTTRPTR